MKEKLLRFLKNSGLMFLIMAAPLWLGAQGSPASAIQLQNYDTTITASMTDTLVYYKFVATGRQINASLVFTSKSGGNSSDYIELLDSNLNRLNFSNDSSLIVSSNSLLIGKYYFVKIRAQINDAYKLLLGDVTIIVYPSNSICPDRNKCNLLTNSSFDNVFYPATISITNVNGNETNPLFYDAFGLKQDTLALVDSNKNFYSHMVCDWWRLSNTPNIKNDTVMHQYAAMWGLSSQQECIATYTKVYPGVPYIINYDLMYNNIASFNGAVKFGFRPNDNMLSQAPFLTSGVVYYNKILFPGSQSWHHITDTFLLSPLTYGYIPMKSLMIYPYSSFQVPGTINMGIDNIVLIPLNSPSPPTPVISGSTHICNSNLDSIFTYKIDNYDSLWVYYAFVSNNAGLNYSKKIFTDTFNVNIGLSTETSILVKVCGKEGFIKVFRCCDPYLPSDSDIYYCNDTISAPQTIDGKNISICGWLQINADVTIKNSKLLFGPESGIRVSTGFNFSLINDTLSDACEYFWKGIYSSDSTSELIMDSCYIEHAHSAINSYNNSELYVENTRFENNQVGIHIRSYNPEVLQPYPDSVVFPPPSANYIAANSFVYTNKYISTNTSFSNPIGIAIDTVYQITVGDSTSISKRNYFDSLRYGIKATYSDLSVFNSEFSSIKIDTSTNAYHYLVNSYVEPLEGAIHFTKPKLPAGSFPPVQLVNKAIGTLNLTVGGDLAKSCHFDNCNFGIYSYKAYNDICDNTFLNQKYNAIYLKETTDSYVKNNNITMTANFPLLLGQHSILKASIQIRNLMHLSWGRKIWVLNNVINNTKVGISLLQCSSTSNNTEYRYTKIGNNDIYFNNINTALGGEYCGIKVQACDRIRIGGNIVESNLNPQISWNVKNLIGISIAQSRETWVADNFSIRNMKAGIYAVGHCQNSQFACNKLFFNTYGIYFEPFDSSNGDATVVSSQGYAGRASDNEWYNGQNSVFRVGGDLNMVNYTPNWYFRDNDFLANKFSPDLLDSSNSITGDIIPIPNTNVSTQCAFQMDEPPIDMDFRTIAGMVRDLRLGDIVMENIDYMILEDEFEYFDQQYLYEILYSNPEIMNLGEPDDSSYINFYNYLTNTNIREFIELQELIDAGDINAALMSNGIIVAENVIETNIQATNDIYLNTLAQDVELDSVDRQNLFAIAMLTPYVGGEGVYTARAMLGIDPEDYNLPYRIGHFGDSTKIVEANGVKLYPNPTNGVLTIEFENNIETAQIIIYSLLGKEVFNKYIYNQISTIDLVNLKSGIYFYRISGNSIETISGKIIKQ